MPVLLQYAPIIIIIDCGNAEEERRIIIDLIFAMLVQPFSKHISMTYYDSAIQKHTALTGKFSLHTRHNACLYCSHELNVIITMLY